LVASSSLSRHTQTSWIGFFVIFLRHSRCWPGECWLPQVTPWASPFLSLPRC
jgi:hypothetical protein